MIFIQLLGCPRLVQLLCYLVKVFMLFAHKLPVSFLLWSGFSVCKDWMQSECRAKWIKSERSKSCASCATLFNISAPQSFSSHAPRYLTNFRSFQKQYSDHVHVWICSQFWKYSPLFSKIEADKNESRQKASLIWNAEQISIATNAHSHLWQISISHLWQMLISQLYILHE